MQPSDIILQTHYNCSADHTYVHVTEEQLRVNGGEGRPG